jgi:hypothetical protein
MPIGLMEPIEAADEPGEEPRPMPAITEISRRVSALWHAGHATMSALAEVVMASKRPSHSWQRYSCSGIGLDCSGCLGRWWLWVPRWLSARRRPSASR